MNLDCSWCGARHGHRPGCEIGLDEADRKKIACLTAENEKLRGLLREEIVEASSDCDCGECRWCRIWEARGMM